MGHLIIPTQIIINGILIGSIYALAGMGFSLIYSTCKYLHFMYGGLITISAYIFFFSLGAFNYDLIIPVFLTIAFSVSIGNVVNNFIYQPLYKRRASRQVAFIINLFVLNLIEALLLLAFGASPRSLTYRYKLLEIKHEIWGAVITNIQIIIISSCILSFLFLYWLLKKTKTGIAIKAVANDKVAAQLVGISLEKVYTQVFTISSFFSSLSAIFLVFEQNIQPGMGTALIIKGFTAATIGGVGLILGSMPGALFLGMLENLGAWFFPSGYRDTIAFVSLFIFLLFIPQGILSFKKNYAK
jgi:branched-chain amino acid transport system permease protein